MAAVCGAECIVHVYIAIGSQSLGEFFLALLHFLFSGFIGGIFFVDTHGLAFFFGVETEVFQQQSLAGLKGSSHVGSGHAVGSELNICVQSLAHGIFNLSEREFCVYFAFGFAHVAHDDSGTAVGEDFLESGEGTTDTGVVGDVSVFVQRYVEVNAYQCFVTVEIEIVDSHCCVYC